MYFLSPSTAGLLTVTEPSVVGQVSLPVGVASSTTSLYVLPKRGVVVGGANLRTTISLSNIISTPVQNASAYDAGELSGWVYIENTTAANSLRFYVQAQFSKKGGSADYNLSYQTTGDTPPAGFSVSISSSGVISIAALGVASGFVSANINFGLNVPAVGATLPLQINSSLVSNSDGSSLTSKLVTGMVVTDSSLMFRNRIINGDMRIYQRNAGANVGLGCNT